MENARQITTAVSSIQNELSKIILLVQGVKASVSNPQDFLNKLITEFNTKLRLFKSKNTLLQAENRKLKQQISILELELGDTVKHIHELRRQLAENTASLQTRDPEEPTEPSITLNSPTRMKPPSKRRRSQETETCVFSSPIKASTELMPSRGNLTPSGIKSPMEEGLPKELTSSQFNVLPTQYSDASLLPKKDSNGMRFQERALSQEIRSENENSGSVSDTEDFIVYSEDEVEPLDAKEEMEATTPPSGAKYPSHYTALQRAEFLRTFYQIKLQDKNYLCEMSTNPITEKPWALDDFVPNKNWKPAKRLNTNLGVLSKLQEKRYLDFFKQAGHGAKPTGPRWNDVSEAEAELCDGEEEIVKSQLIDKYLSPPGYMIGDFVSTQEAKENKAMVKRKESERIQRRLASAFKGGEFIFYEDVFNSIVALGRIK